MTLEELIEQNANLTLWGVSVAGPDDLYAEISHAAAVSAAEKLNRDTRTLLADRPNDILCFAYPIVWPYSAENHAQALKDQAEQEAKFNAARAALA